jgi:2-polyprenyl-3-methyl-5-hydroxy-6-metoxy-1,4-benzoquinol methylase
MEHPQVSSERHACPVCATGIENALADSANFVRCRSCELIYRKVIPDALGYQGWDQTYYADERVIAYYERRRSAFHKIVWLMNRYADQPGVWLDIGCGLGGMLQAAHEQGWSVAGIEPSRTSVESLRRRMPSARVVHGTVEDRLSDFHDVSVASFVDVLRYMAEPRGVLATLHTALNVGGWVVIREVEGDRRKERRASEQLDTRVGWESYLQEWSPQSMRKTLELAGFTNVQTLPSPMFTETAGCSPMFTETPGLDLSRLRGHSERVAKVAAWPVARLAHVLSRERLYLTPNFLALGEKCA